MLRMKEAAERSDPSLQQLQQQQQQGRLTQLELDAMLAQSIHMKRMQTEINSQKSDIKAVQSGMQTMEAQLKGSDVKLDNITDILTNKKPSNEHRRSSNDANRTAARPVVSMTAPGSGDDSDGPFSGRDGSSARSDPTGGRSVVNTPRDISLPVAASASGISAEERTDGLDRARAAEEADERADLARAEANAALQTGRAAEAGRIETPTPHGSYEHMPEPLRPLLPKVTDAVFTPIIHENFSNWVSCDENQETKKLNTKTTAEPDMSFTPYWEKLGACKSLAQWRAKALRLKVPEDAVLASRTKTDIGRCLYIQYAILAKPGSVISGNLKSREHFFNENLLDWWGS